MRHLVSYVCIVEQRQYTTMRLTDEALAAIKSNYRLRNLLGLALNCVDRTIMRYVATKDDELTKAAALKVIREETGLSDDRILEDSIGVAV